ncbi:hypothetical protein C826_00748 [Helicobacter bilis WiWa]|uniref:Lipoprotein n=1 Tax=Helicobacter bilis WiWa TaxID=1235804 RepID=N2BIA5_9HELI|nr:hypothetical protein [Helicobacter bilis]EMZ39926.1 hypothetical protein C826_00748 [Helicobacter bilis WiWa]
MKKLLLVASGALSLILLSGCSSLVATKMDSNVGYLVQFNGSDFNVGDVVSAEMPYDAKNPNIAAMVLNKAIVDNKCDTIFYLAMKLYQKLLVKIS